MKKIKIPWAVFSDAGLISGVILIVIGAGMIDRAIGYIVGGVLAILIGLIIAFERSDD